MIHLPIFDEARARVSCADVAERRVKLVRGRGPCPINGCGETSKAAPFVVLKARGGEGDRWKCWSCDPRGGDVVDLEHRLFSSGDDTLADAARRLVGGEVRQESDASRARRAQDRARREAEALASEAWKADLARRLWREAVPAGGTPVQVYLEHREIRGPVAARMLGQLRYHPRAYHHGDPELGVFLPAMIGLVVTELGPTGGIHATYLRPDGRGKTHHAPAKQMWGPQGHRLVARSGDRMGPPNPKDPDDLVVVRLPGGIWLTRPDIEGPLVSAEGIETSASRAIMLAGPLSKSVRAVAACSLDRLQGFEVLDAEGARDVRHPKGDPLRPPFTWPEDPARPWGLIDIACDGDMSPVRVLGRVGLDGKKTVTVVRDAAERARVCGALAIAGWRRRLAPGSQTVVRASRSPQGRDFNDVLKSGARVGKVGA